MSIYIRYQGRKQGPLSEAQLATLLRRGTVSKETEASLDEKNWQPLGSLPVFKKLYEKIAEVPLKTVAPPVLGQSVPPVLSKSVPPVLDKPDESGLFAAADFPHNQFAPKANAIQHSMPVTPPSPPVLVSEPAPFISSLRENPKLLYTIGGGALGLLLLFAAVVTMVFGSAAPKGENNASANEPASQSQSATEETPAVPDSSETAQEAKAAAEKAEQEEQARKEAEVKAAAEKAEQAKKEAEAKAAEEERSKILDAELAKAVNSLDEIFPLKPLLLSAGGDVLRPESLDPKFAGLWQPREKLSLQYVSYIQQKDFSIKNVSPHEIVILYNNDDVFRFFLDEKGLHGQWLDAPSVTKESFRILNGIALGELEIVPTSGGRSIKSVSLFPPAEYAVFRPWQKQISLTGIDFDFDALGFSGVHLTISDVKGYRTKYTWKTLESDTLQFQAGENDAVQIKLIPQTPVSGKEKSWNIPVEVKEIKRDSALLRRYISGTNIAAEMVDDKVKEGTAAVTRVRSDMLQVRRQFNRNNSEANKADKAIGVLKRKLAMPNSPDTQIRTQIAHQERIISNCRSSNIRLKPELMKLESVYDDYLGKLKVLKEYNALLDKPAIIYNSEPITFTMAIQHPTDSERYLKLFSIKEPDLANEKDAVIPEPVDDDMKTDDEKDDEDSSDGSDGNESKDSNERSFLNTDKK